MAIIEQLCIGYVHINPSLLYTNVAAWDQTLQQFICVYLSHLVMKATFSHTIGGPFLYTATL